MATLTLIKVDLVLDLVDVFSLLCKSVFVHLPLFKRFLFLFVVFVDEDGLVCTVKLLLLILKLFAKFTDVVEIGSI